MRSGFWAYGGDLGLGVVESCLVVLSLPLRVSPVRRGRVAPPFVHIRPSVRFGPPLERLPTNPNRSRPNVRCACVRRNGVVRESMGEGVEAGISFWIGGGADGLAEAAPPHPTASRPPSPTRGEGEARRAGISFCGAHPLLSSLSGLTRQSATLLRALKGLGSLRRGGTHICCAFGSLAGPRVEPEDDEGG